MTDMKDRSSDAATAETFDDKSVEKLIDDVRRIRPLLEAEAEAGEAQRSPTGTVVSAIEDLGAWSLILPKRLGGRGISSSAFARVQAELAKGDPSVAWVSHIINGTSWIASLGSDALQETLFSSGPARVCGAVNPPGRAIRVNNGYRVSGAFLYSSGSRQADWFQCSVKLEGGGSTADSSAINMAYVHSSEVQISDTWYVTGLQGTGSDTTVVEEIFVPDARFVPSETPFGHVEPNKRHWGAPSDFLPIVPTVRTLCVAQLIGAAQAMVDLVAVTAQKRGIITTSYSRQAESPVFQHHVGEASAKIDTAWLIVENCCRQLDSLAEERGSITPAEAARNKAQISLAVDLMLSAVDRLMTISGSSAFATSNPLQRYWRDINMGARHVTTLPHVGYEIAGRELLGVSPNITPFGAF